MMIITDDAARKLRVLTTSWNDTHPEKPVMPSLFMAQARSGKSVLQVGFLEISERRDTPSFWDDDLEVLLHFTPAEMAKYSIGTLSFDGAIFHLSPAAV